jgi:hypothetical protein
MGSEDFLEYMPLPDDAYYAAFIWLKDGTVIGATRLDTIVELPGAQYIGRFFEVTREDAMEICRDCGIVPPKSELIAAFSAAEPPANTKPAPTLETPPETTNEAKGTPADDRTVWISFAQAKKMTGLRDDEITRACDSDKVRSQGKRRGRRVHSGDIARFVTERSGRQN